jgi:hypothetical protein
MRLQLSNAIVGRPAAKTVSFRPAGGTYPKNLRKLTNTLSYYDAKNILVKYYVIAMIVHSVVYTTFRPKGNNNSRNKYIFESNNILLGGKPL